MFDDLDYSDFVTIKIARVKYIKKPSHWEITVTDNTGHEIGSGTGPTFAGVVDMAIEMASERHDLDDPEWSKFDANGGK